MLPFISGQSAGDLLKNLGKAAAVLHDEEGGEEVHFKEPEDAMTKDNDYSEYINCALKNPDHADIFCDCLPAPTPSSAGSKAKEVAEVRQVWSLAHAPTGEKPCVDFVDVSEIGWLNLKTGLSLLHT